MKNTNNTPTSVATYNTQRTTTATTLLALNMIGRVHRSIQGFFFIVVEKNQYQLNRHIKRMNRLICV